ncbi:MAG: hypothetical protein R2705_09425 [Ilumatobacteraceae bacterium]
MPTAYYLPKADRWSTPRASANLPVQGDASYWTILPEAAARSRTMPSPGATKPPTRGAEEIEGHVAFFANRAEILVSTAPGLSQR